MPNAKLNLDIGRQKPLFAEIAFDFTHVADSAVAVKALNLPYGAQIISGSVIVDTAFNPGTSLVLNVGDAITPNRYLANANLAALGRTAIVPTGFVSDGAPVVITPTLVGAPASAGKARLHVSYVLKGRAEEVQP